MHARLEHVRSLSKGGDNDSRACYQVLHWAQWCSLVHVMSAPTSPVAALHAFPPTPLPAARAVVCAAWHGLLQHGYDSITLCLLGWGLDGVGQWRVVIRLRWQLVQAHLLVPPLALGIPVPWGLGEWPQHQQVLGHVGNKPAVGGIGPSAVGCTGKEPALSWLAC